MCEQIDRSAQVVEQVDEDTAGNGGLTMARYADGKLLIGVSGDGEQWAYSSLTLDPAFERDRAILRQIRELIANLPAC